MKHKLKRIFKRAVPLVLVCTLTIGAVLGHNTKEVKALTGVEEAALVTAILLAYGYVTTRYFNDTDGANALKNDMEQAYEEARFKVLNGGASGGGGDEDPDNNDFEDIDGDGRITEKDIPQFKDISLTKKAAFALSANVTALLSPIVSKFVQDNNIVPTDLAYYNLVDNTISNYCKENDVDLSVYNSFCMYSWGSDIEVFYGTNAWLDTITHPGYLYVTDGLPGRQAIRFNFRSYSPEKIRINETDTWASVPTRDSNIVINVPFRGTPENHTESIAWTTPELRDNFDPHGKLDLIPQFDPNFNYNMPSADTLQQLLQNLVTPSLTTDQQNQLLLDYMNNLKNEPINKPEPSPEPNPDPSPEPSPEPNPEPGENEDNGKFTADLKTLFPFCIPFDLVDCFKLFNAEPETPRIEVPMHFGIIDVDYTWVIDLKDFDSVAVICRSMFLILFLIGLALATSKVIKW